ncbi:hypothetical protein B9J07_27925 [Sinorhizobium sp. LM21]|uniref:SPFH domain-containing protein n=1 Tax=Sinorhizobium sp. LM21 TaxID=1449788 RepID=UPI0005DA0FA7|nr:SPFH domain-containing protein [Sinorhizobium sp. LM21]AJW30179.1 SPFH domain protein [Sinorhizobium sp. LM21]OWZ90418.1 hypothetical protein B9J07_27925 [Sinorhizobium sp. LM21]
MNLFKLIPAAIVGLLALSVAGGSFYTVDEGEKSVITRNGAVVGVAEAGFHWKMPFMDTTHPVSLRDGMIPFENIEAYTSDGQTATVHAISISYRVKPTNEDVTEVYTRYGSPENAVSQMVSRRVGESLETVFGQFNADNAIKRRADLGIEFAKRIKNVDGPVEILAAQIENFSLPKSYEDNIEAKMTQEVEVKKLEEKEKQATVSNRIAVANAEAAAAAQLKQANAVAEATRIQGKAVADAIREKNEAIKESPNLVELVKAERWDGKLPQTFVPGSSVPFLNIK